MPQSYIGAVIDHWAERLEMVVKVEGAQFEYMLRKKKEQVAE